MVNRATTFSRATTFENHLLMFTSFVCYFISYNRNYILHLIFLLRLKVKEKCQYFSRSCLKQSVPLQFIRLPVFQLNTRKIIYNSFKTFSEYVRKQAMIRGNYFMKTLTCMDVKKLMKSNDFGVCLASEDKNCTVNLLELSLL